MPSIKERFNRLADMARPFGLTPVFRQKYRITPSSVLSDKMALHQSLLLCQSCAWRLQPKRFEYMEVTMFHAEGFCDSDWCGQVEGPASLYLWEGSEQWYHRSTVSPSFDAVIARERASGQRLR